MSKSGKKAKHAKKMQAKRQMKAQRKALYASLAGSSKKRKRRQEGGATAARKSHVMADCGNPGCSRCYPALNSARFGKPTHSKELK